MAAGATLTSESNVSIQAEGITESGEIVAKGEINIVDTTPPPVVEEVEVAEVIEVVEEILVIEVEEAVVDKTLEETISDILTTIITTTQQNTDLGC